MQRILFATALAIAMCGTASMRAHHSGVMFEESKEVTLQGVVKEFQVHEPAFMAARRGGRR